MPVLLALEEEAKQEMDTTSKTPQGARAADRVLEALVTLAALLDRAINEVKSLDSDFQKRVLQAVHETEISLQSQAAHHVETAITESRDKFEAHFKAKLEDISLQWETER